MNVASPRKLHVFLSYAQEDKQIVSEFSSKLKKVNWVESWVADENLLPGKVRVAGIFEAMLRADIILLFLSKKSVTRKVFGQKEISFASQKEISFVLTLAEQKPPESIFIIPIRLEESEIPVQLWGYQWQDYYPDNYKDAAFDRIIASLSEKAGELRKNGQNIVSIVEIKREDLINKIEVEKSKDDFLRVALFPKNENMGNSKKSSALIDEFRSYGWATCKNPGLLIYIIDVSESMNELWNGERKIGLANSLLQLTFQNLISRSRDGNKIFPTYKIGVFAYAENVIPIYDGLKTLDQIAAIGAPEISDVMKESTDTAKAFAHVLKLLKSELAEMQDSPAPLICHITDGMFTGEDPVLLARELMSTGTNGGNTLMQHVFLMENMLVEPIEDLASWRGIKQKSSLKHKYAKKLFDMSSKIPDKYLGAVKERNGYAIESGTRFLFPAEALDMASQLFAQPSLLEW